MLFTYLDVSVEASRAWDLLIDTQAWSRWGPSVRGVDCAARRIGPGVCGRVQTAPGLWLRFEITAWEEGRAWAWRVGGVPATSHHVDLLGPMRCRVGFGVPVWAPFYLPVCQLALRRLSALARAA
jgi:hypothetical protein